MSVTKSHQDHEGSQKES